MRYLLSLLIGIFFTVLSGYMIGVNSNESMTAHVITNCDGTQFLRTTPGEMHVQTVAKNLPGCIGLASSGGGESHTLSVTSDVTNCSGLRIIAYSDGTMKSLHVGKNTLGCIRTTESVGATSGKTIDLSHGPLLDLASTDIVNYRAKLLKDKGVRFANAVRSARIRREATKKSPTEAILMRNDAVIVEGKETGWVKVQGAKLEVTDTRENTVEADTAGKADGFTASRLLRDPNTSDLVAIEQADHAYWSDIAYTNVAKYVNVRLHPNYTAPIITTLGRDYPLFVISTVDNWSLVRNEEGTVRGYIRSDYLRIEKIQRVDTSLGVR